MDNELFRETNIAKAYFTLSLPLMLSMVITLIYNLADTYFVARTGDTALVAGVSICAPIFTLLMAFGNIFGQGGASLISRLMGQGDGDSVRHVSSFCFYAAILTGAGSAVILLVFRMPLLSLLGASADTLPHALAYLTCLSIGAPAIILSFIHSNLLRSEGMSKESMIGTVGGALINIILDPIMISFMGMGAMGAAAATVIGYLCADIFFVIIVWKRSRLFSLSPADMKISQHFFRQIMGIGIPAAIVNIMQSVSIILTNQFLAPYGNDRIAAMGIVLKINMIMLLTLTGFSFGGQPLFGYYYGAGDYERFRRLYQFCLKFISLIAIIMTAVVFASAKELLKIFMSDPAVVNTGCTMLRLQVITMVFTGFIMLVTIMFQSTGKIMQSFILSLGRQGVIFAIVLFVAVKLFGYTGILLSQAVSDIITGIIAAFLFYNDLYPEIR